MIIVHKLESELENEMQKDLLIHKRIAQFRSDIALINKKKRTCRFGDFTASANHILKIKENEKSENERRRKTGKIPGPCQRTETL